MSNSPGALVPAGAQLSTFFLASLGASFSSGAGYAAVVNHGFPTLTPTPPNIIGGTNALGRLDYSVPIEVAFFDPTNTSNKATTGFVQVLGDEFGFGSGFATLLAFDIFGVLIGTDTDSDAKPLGQGPVLTIAAPGIHRVSFFSSNATVGFDNFEFGALTASPPIPEPATWLTMLAGFGAVGWSLRQRRSARSRFA
jgi:hypothetical protein